MTTQRSDIPSKSAEVSVLLVDDHPIMRTGLAQVIRQHPTLRVGAEAATAREALEAVRRGGIGLALVDLSLRDSAGIELIRRMKSVRPELLILVHSMHDEALYAERTLRAGASGYVMKQEGAEKLAAAIRAVLRGEVYVSERIAAGLLGGLAAGRGPRDDSGVGRLSDREIEVFELLGRGLSTRGVAERLGVSVKTVESHREHIKSKLDLKNANELIRHAAQWAMREA